MKVEAQTMSTEKQIIILRKILAFTYFVIQLFGLWPYSVDKAARLIKINLLKFVYSILVPLAVLYLYFGFVLVQLASAQSKSLHYIESKTLGRITNFYSIIMIVSYMLLYAGQHFKFEAVKSVYLNCVEIIELSSTFFDRNADLSKFFLNFFIKTIVFDISTVLVLYYNFYRSSNVLAIYPYLPLFLYMPIMAVRLFENLFYGGVLLFEIAFKHLNRTLLQIVTIKAISESGRKNKIGKHCQLSDELDKLAELHLKLRETTKVFNSIFELQLLFWIIVQLSGLLIRTFFQYVGIVHLLNNKGSYSFVVWQNFITMIVSLTTWIEIYQTSSACESLVNEVCTQS